MWLVEGHIGTRQKGIYRVRASHELARVSVSYDEANLVSGAGLLPEQFRLPVDVIGAFPPLFLAAITAYFRAWARDDGP